jgi:hypothetical protein
VAVSAFPGELYQAPRSWKERAYPKLIHYNKIDKGGHFAAWEQPQLFSEEVRAGGEVNLIMQPGTLRQRLHDRSAGREARGRRPRC